jgi:hypothetical protein
MAPGLGPELATHLINQDALRLVKTSKGLERSIRVEDKVVEGWEMACRY